MCQWNRFARSIVFLGLGNVFLLGFVLSVLVVGLQAQQSTVIQEIEIRHIGPPAASEELIRSNLRAQVGDVYNPTGIQDDVKNLYATGLFRNIRLVEETTVNGIRLVFVVQGNPTLTEILFEGNEKYSRSKLMDKVTSEVGEALDERKLFTDTQAIKEMYQKAGYPNTEVEYRLNIDEAAGRGTATIVIRESPKTKIERVDFIGASAFKQKKLRKEVKTREWWIFSWLTGSGYLKDDVLAADRDRLTEFYRNEGYIDFQIKDIQFDYLSERKMIVRFFVFEGNQYKVGSIQIEGNSLFPAEEIRQGWSRGEGLEMTEGEVFTPKGLNDDLQAIRDYYGAKGYIDTSVRAEKIPNTIQGTMDLVYHINEGDQVNIERIDIRGNTKTKDKVIRRELAVNPGEVFDMVRVRISRQRLEQMDYFSKVDTRPEDTEIEDRKNLVIAVEEKSTGNINMGAGFSSIDSLFGFVTVTQGNFDLFNPPYFTGGGQKLRLNTTLGLRRRDYQLTFIEPWFLGKKLQFGVDLYHRNLLFLSDEYEQSQTGARVSLKKALWSDFLIGGVSYTIEEIGITDVEDEASDIIKAEEGHRLVSKVGTSLAWDTRNNVQLPDRGQRTELLTEVAGGPFGADTDIYKLELSSVHYFPGFFEGHVIEVGGSIGVVDHYSNTERTPIFDRFFLGGANTLRGFRYRDVGPKDEFGEPIGGGTFWFGSVEYSVPLIDRLRFATFYDIGMVYLDPYSFDQDGAATGSYNDNWGVGFRLNLPIGPLRLDYGIPITADRENDSSGRFQFNVGYTRPF